MNKNDLQTGGNEKVHQLTGVVLLVVGIALFLLLLYLTAPALSPFLVIIAFIFLLYPIRHQYLVGRLMFAGIALFVFWLIVTLAGVLTPFLLAFLIAFILSPVVDILEKKMPRWFASLLVLVGILGAIVSLVLLFIPILITQSGNIFSNISGFAQGVVEFVRDGRLVSFLQILGVPPDQIQVFLSNELPSRLEGILRTVLQAVVGFVTNFSAMISQILNLIILPFAAFYFLKDYGSIVGYFRDLLPDDRRPMLTEYFSRVNSILGQYIRGVIILAFLQGVLTGIGLYILGIQYPLLLGIVAGILSVIPFVGFYGSLVFAIISALFSGGEIMMKVGSVLLLYVGLNLLETMFLSPKIIGNRVGIHPVLLILSLTVFGFFLGFVGLIIAVPATAVLLMTAEWWKGRV